MTIKVSVCNTDRHREIRVTQSGKSQPDGALSGARISVVLRPLTAQEFYVHRFQSLEIEEIKQ